MGRHFGRFYYENSNSSTENNPFIERIIRDQEERRLVKKIAEEVKRELAADEKWKQQQAEKSLRQVVDEAAETIEKEFEKHGGTVSR